MTPGNDVSWFRSLAGRLGATTVLLAILAFAILGVKVQTVDMMRAEIARDDLMKEGRWRSYALLAEAGQIPLLGNDERLRMETDVRRALVVMTERFRTLRTGDRSLRIEPATGVLLEDIRKRETAWQNEVHPLFQELLQATTEEDRRRIVARLRPQIEDNIAALGAAILEGRHQSDARLEGYDRLTYVFAALVLAAAGFALLLARNVSLRVRSLAEKARIYATGEIAAGITIGGSDEVAHLEESLDNMAASLRKGVDDERGARASLGRMLDEVRDVSTKLAAAATEIAAATAEQASGAQEQSSSVTDTAATVDEVAASAAQASERALGVTAAVQRSEETSQAGLEAMEELLASMDVVRTRMAALAEGVLGLAEKGQSIGEIIAVINDIAEQSHVLSLNAALEATRAGEQGKGFAVVAGEVKALAEQSKKATAQVRKILGDIQKGTQTAVMGAEEVSKSATAGSKVASDTGAKFRKLAEHITESAASAQHTVAAAGQQATGMAQVRQAIRQINQASQQNVVAIRQTEQSARDLSSMGSQLQRILSGTTR